MRHVSRMCNVQYMRVVHGPSTVCLAPTKTHMWPGRKKRSSISTFGNITWPHLTLAITNMPSTKRPELTTIYHFIMREFASAKRLKKMKFEKQVKIGTNLHTAEMDTREKLWLFLLLFGHGSNVTPTSSRCIICLGRGKLHSHFR